jgi:hypothetical protein
MSQTVLAAGLLALILSAGQATESSAPTGVIAGRVLDDATHQPLAGTRVFLYAIPFAADDRPPLAVTNGNGDYVFEGVTPGLYHLGAFKSGFFFPSSTGGSALVDLGIDQRRRDIDLTMSSGGVLTGRILDESGRPLSGISVGALRFDGIVRLDQAIPSLEMARTDYSGVFQVHGLIAGQYVVVAGRPSGASALAKHVPYSLTYFPGSLDLRSAQLVSLGPGGTVGELDFTMRPASTFEVSGVAVDDAGRRVPGALVALEADWPLFGGPVGSSTTDAGGRFRIKAHAHGDYRLTVTPPGVEPTRVTRQTPFLRVRVVEADVSGLTILVPMR